MRLGTYGDPMAAPHGVWADLIYFADGHTGYTHQWNNENIPFEQRDAIRALCMASVDSEGEWEDAMYNNWRTFRIRSTDDGLNLGEFACPASEEAGKRKTCDTCMACNGVGANNERINRATPVIIVHGTLKKRFAASLAV